MNPIAVAARGLLHWVLQQFRLRCCVQGAKASAIRTKLSRIWFGEEYDLVLHIDGAV